MKYVNERDERMEIVVMCFADYGNRFRYVVHDVLVTPPRKRKSKSMADEIRDRYDYRSTPYNQRGEFVRQEFVKLCTQERINQAIQEAYENMHNRIKPENAEIEYRIY